MIADLLFLMFAFFLLLAAGGVVVAKNPMLCVLFLVGCFVNAAGLFIMLGAEFLGLLLVMVYVGAVAVMFLFVVMTINIDFAKLKEGFAPYLPVGILVGALLAVELGLAVFGGIFADSGKLPIALQVGEAADENIMQLGKILFTNYALPFQMAGIILLTAMVGAIVLTHRQRSDVKRQKVAQQVGRKRADSLKIVSVESGAAQKFSHFVGKDVK